MILFGTRSPIVVEYEESCARLNIEIIAGVNLAGTPRTLARDIIIDLEDFEPHQDAQYLACAFAPRRRKALADQAQALGLTLAPALIDPHAVVARSVRIGDGSFINAGVVIGALTLIGENVLINRTASIGHHCLLGDYISIGPGATLAGNIRVGEGTIIGAGATILPDIRIGEGCIVAGGSLVREEVPDNTFVAGNPATARPFDPQSSSLYIEDGE